MGLWINPLNLSGSDYAGELFNFTQVKQYPLLRYWKIKGLAVGLVRRYGLQIGGGRYEVRTLGKSSLLHSIRTSSQG